MTLSKLGINMVFCTVLFCILAVSGQHQKKMDSLKKALELSETDSLRYDKLNLIIRDYLSINMDSARFYNEILLKLANSTDNISISAKCFNLGSVYYYYNSQLDSSLFYVKKSLSQIKNSDYVETKADLYRKLAILSRANLDFEAYENYADLALREAKKTDNWVLVATCLIVKGNIAFNKNDYSNALVEYRKVDSIHTFHDSITSNLPMALENIGLIHTELKSNEAITYFDRSIAAHEKMGNQAGVNNSIRLKGSFYNKNGNPEESNKYLLQTLPFYKKLNEPNKLVEVYSEFTSVALLKL